MLDMAGYCCVRPDPSLRDVKVKELRSLAAVSPDGRTVAVQHALVDAIVDPFFFARVIWYFAERVGVSRVRAFVDVNQTIVVFDKATGLEREGMIREAVLGLFTVQCPAAPNGAQQTAYNYLRWELKGQKSARSAEGLQKVVADVRAKGAAISLGCGGANLDLDQVEQLNEAFVARYKGAIREGDDGMVRSWLPFLDAFGNAPHLIMFYPFQTDWTHVMEKTASEQQSLALRFFKSVGEKLPEPTTTAVPLAAPVAAL
jgi:hypothetical protein